MSLQVNETPETGGPRGADMTEVLIELRVLTFLMARAFGLDDEAEAMREAFTNP